MRIHCSLRKQKCRLKSTTTNGWRHFGQPERRKSSVLFPIQSEKSPDSGFFTCDPTKKCIMLSSRERHKGIIGRGHDLRLSWGRLWAQDKSNWAAKSAVFRENSKLWTKIHTRLTCVSGEEGHSTFFPPKSHCSAFKLRSIKVKRFTILLVPSNRKSIQTARS